MKRILIEEEFLSNQGCEEDHEWATYKIYMNNKEVISFNHNTKTPKDNTLFNNCKDCLNILPLLEEFYNLGKNNIEIEFKIKS